MAGGGVEWWAVVDREPPILRGAIARFYSLVSCYDQGLSGHLWRQFFYKFGELSIEIAPRGIGVGDLDVAIEGKALLHHLEHRSGRLINQSYSITIIN